MTNDEPPSTGITEQPGVTGRPKKPKRRRESNKGLPRTVEDVKAMLAVTTGRTMTDMVSEATEMRIRQQQAEKELEVLRKKISKNDNFAREGVERALAIAGESPAETLAKLLHMKAGEDSKYALDVRERTAIAKALLPYMATPFKSQEPVKDGSSGITVVVQNFGAAKPEAKRLPVIEVKETE